MELCRDNEHKPWVDITVIESKKLVVEFDEDFVEPGQPICITSKLDAEQLSDVLRNILIDYMED